MIMPLTAVFIFTSFLGIDKNRKITSAILYFGTIIFFKLFFFHKITVYRDKKNINHKIKPAIFIGNHSSRYDGLLLFYLNRHIKIITRMKWYNPFDWLQFFAGNPQAKGSSSMKGFYLLKKMQTIMEKGIPLVFFPEGHRSTNSAVGLFNKGAFRIAKEIRADIIPFALDSWNVLRPGSMLIRDIKPRIKILPAISYEEYRSYDEKIIAETVRIKIIEALLDIRTLRKKEEPDYYRNSVYFEKIDSAMMIELEKLKYKKTVL